MSRGRRWKLRPAPQPEPYVFSVERYVTYTPEELAEYIAATEAEKARRAGVRGLVRAFRAMLEEAT